MEANVSPSLGYDEQWFNGGEFTNQGIELSLTATPVQAAERVYVGDHNVRLSELQRRELTAGAGIRAPEQRRRQPRHLRWSRVGRSVSQIVGETNGPSGQPVQVGDEFPAYVTNFDNEFTLGRFHATALVVWSKVATRQLHRLSRWTGARDCSPILP